MALEFGIYHQSKLGMFGHGYANSGCTIHASLLIGSFCRVCDNLILRALEAHRLYSAD
jgi:hypothetical protein